MCPAARSDIVGFIVTSRGFYTAGLSIALIACVELAAAQLQGQRPLEVSFAPVSPRPGDVARIDVTGAPGDDAITGTMFGETVAFHYDEGHQKWSALVGIDLDTKPGDFQLRIDARGAPRFARMMRIAPRQFRVRRLQVPGGYVDPPADELARIADDSATLAAAYARVSPRQWSGQFLLPVDAPASSNFGTRSYYNGQRRSPHAGVDFAAQTGTPVRAANYGHVVIASSMYFTGNTVVVDYGDRVFSVFAHLSQLMAKPGDRVEPTTVIGLVGATGRVTGPHLHWSVRLSGARVDPLTLISATQALNRHE